LFETESWLDLLTKRNYVSEAEYEELLGRIHEIARLLTARMKSINAGRPISVHEEGPTWQESDSE